MKRFCCISALALIVVILFSVHLNAQSSEPTGIKKYKPTELTFTGEGEFANVFRIITFEPESGVNPAFGGNGFGFIIKLIVGGTPVDTAVASNGVNLHFLSYDYKGNFREDLHVLKDFTGVVFAANAIPTPFGWLGYIIVIDKDFKKLQLLGFVFDEKGDVSGQPVVLGEINAPPAMHDGYTSNISNGGMSDYINNQGLTVCGYANFGESMGTSHVPSGWGAFTANIPTSLPLHANTNYFKNNKNQPYSSYNVNNQSMPAAGENAIDVVRHIASVQEFIYDGLNPVLWSGVGLFQFGVRVNFSPAAKVKNYPLAKNQKDKFGAFPRQQFLPAGTSGNPDMAFYHYRQSIPYSPGNLDTNKSEYYLQDLDGKGKAKGQRRMITMPPWKHRLKKDETKYTVRHNERLSNLAPLKDGRFLALQIRSLERRASGASKEIALSAKPKDTELEANILLFNPESEEMKLVGTVDLKVKEGNYLNNPQAAVGGNYAVFYYEIIDGKTFKKTGYYLSIKSKKLTRKK